MLRKIVATLICVALASPAWSMDRIIDCRQTEWRGVAASQVLDTRFRVTEGRLLEEWNSQENSWKNYCDAEGVTICTVSENSLERWIRNDSVILRTVVDLTSGVASWSAVSRGSGRERAAVGACTTQQR